MRAVSIRIAGDSCDDAIQGYLKQERDLLVGLSTAEQIKCAIGGVLPREENLSMMVRGRRVSSGLPACETITSEELIPLLREQAEQILTAICGLMEITPPELVGDLTETGIVLAGGGSRLYGMDAYLSHELGLEAHGSEDPETCVIMGTSRMLGNLKRMQDGPINIARRRRGLA